jgi:hypothetical protein
MHGYAYLIMPLTKPQQRFHQYSQQTKAGTAKIFSNYPNIAIQGRGSADYS